MSGKRRVVVVGGGISGLAVAHALLDAIAAGRVEVVVLEASARLGGNVHTTRRDGLVLDDGPDSWVASKPHTTQLARALGVGDRLIETIEKNRRVYVVADPSAHPIARRLAALRDGDPLVPMPQGLVLGVPTRALPLLRSPLLSLRGKLRAALDLLAPPGFRRGKGDVDDEAIGALIERRLGREVVDALTGPLLGGLFSGDASSLSVQATFPQLAALELRGGLIRGARATVPARAAAVPPPSGFTSLRGGVGELIDALGARLDGLVRTRTEVRCITRAQPEGDAAAFRIHAGDTAAHASFDADELVLTGPAHVAARLVRGLDAALAGELDAIPYGSSATVFLAYSARDVPRPLDATGYIVPARARRAAIASTWISSKWRGRAPHDVVLLRVFFSGERASLDDAALLALARDEVRHTIGIVAAPTTTHFARFLRASPQPLVGHPARMRRIFERVAGCPGLHLVGSAYDGVGLSDCVRQAQAIAARIGTRA